MTGASPQGPRFSREMRLLILTIVVSGAVLLLLARMRFPAPSPAVDTSSQPLQRLAARASFEELALRVSRLEADVLPNLVVLRLGTAAEAGPLRLSDLTPFRPASQPGSRSVPALRVDASSALAAVPPDAVVTGVVGQAGGADVVQVLAADHLRHVSRVRVPEGPSRALPQMALSALRTPAYVVAVEGTRAGLTLRPVFLGRSERFRSSRWAQPLLPVGAATIGAGALMFTLEGEFLGCAVLDDGALAIADAGDFLQAAPAGSGGQREMADPGLAVQPLTPALAAALGAQRGVVVAEVEDGGAAAGQLAPADVLTEVGDSPVGTPEALLLDLSERLTAGPVQVSFVRAGAVRTARLERAVSPRTAPQTAAAAPGLQLVRGVGTRVVSLSPGSALSLAGLIPGDVVLRAGGDEAPTPSEIRALAAPPAAPQVWVVRRGTRQFVAVVGPAGQGGDGRP